MLILIASLEAILQIELPAIISSNRILQCNTGVSLWGWAKKRAKITLEVSWLDEKLIVSTDKKGRWSVKLKTTLSKVPQTIGLDRQGFRYHS